MPPKVLPARRRPKTGNDRPLRGTVAPPALEGGTPGRRWCLTPAVSDTSLRVSGRRAVGRKQETSARSSGRSRRRRSKAAPEAKMVSDTSGVRHLSAGLWPARRRPKTGNDPPALRSHRAAGARRRHPRRRWCLTPGVSDTSLRVFGRRAVGRKQENVRPLLGTVAPPALEGGTPRRRWCLTPAVSDPSLRVSGQRFGEAALAEGPMAIGPAPPIVRARERGADTAEHPRRAAPDPQGPVRAVRPPERRPLAGLARLPRRRPGRRRAAGARVLLPGVQPARLLRRGPAAHFDRARFTASG